MTQEFLDDGKGHVSGVKTVNVEWTKDDAGRWQMNQVPGSEKVFKADLVLLAMGFLGPERAIGDQLELTLDARSNFSTKDYRTNVKNVFAAGGKIFIFYLFIIFFINDLLEKHPIKRQSITYKRKLNNCQH